jgi:hypothetical protein
MLPINYNIPKLTQYKKITQVCNEPHGKSHLKRVDLGSTPIRWHIINIFRLRKLSIKIGETVIEIHFFSL